MTLKTKLIMIISLLLFLVVGFTMIYGSVISKLDCTEPTIATVIDIEKRSRGGRGLPMYLPTLEYEINGEIYTQKSNTNINPNILGKQIEIKYNPNNPKEITFSAQKGNVIIIGGGFIFIAVIFILGILRNKTI